jgi:hypothetical protein
MTFLIFNHLVTKGVTFNYLISKRWFHWKQKHQLPEPDSQKRTTTQFSLNYPRISVEQKSRIKVLRSYIDNLNTYKDVFKYK